MASARWSPRSTAAGRTTSRASGRTAIRSLQLLERLSDWFRCKRDARAAQAQVDADSSPVFGRRTALGSDVAPRPERFTTYHVRLSDISASLRRDRSMACLFVDLSHLREVERELGPTHHADVMARAGDLLDRMRGDRLRRDDLICRTADSDGYLASWPRRATTADRL